MLIAMGEDPFVIKTTRVDALCCPIDYDPRYLAVLPEEVIERDYGCAPLEESLRAPVQGRAALATAVR
jgi:hypothetical protein